MRLFLAPFHEFLHALLLRHLQHPLLHLDHEWGKV
jgi:hypothetical protein